MINNMISKFKTPLTGHLWLNIYSGKTVLAAYTPDEILQTVKNKIILPIKFDNSEKYEHNNFILSETLRNYSIVEDPKNKIIIHDGVILDFLVTNAGIENIRSKLLKSEKFLDGDPVPSQFNLEVGSVSSDGSTIVGKCGNLFLHSGTNMLCELYGLSVDDSRKISDQWVEIIKMRKIKCDEMGAKFFQIIIPEKTSILHEFYPRFIGKKTPFLNILEQLIDKNIISSCTQSLYKFIFYHADKNLVFRKIDSHFSIQGADIVSN